MQFRYYARLISTAYFQILTPCIMNIIWCLFPAILSLYSCRDSKSENTILVKGNDTLSTQMPLTKDSLPSIDYSNVTYGEYHIFNLDKQSLVGFMKSADTSYFNGVVVVNIDNDYFEFEETGRLLLCKIYGGIANFDSFECGQNINDIPIFYPNNMHLFEKYPETGEYPCGENCLHMYVWNREIDAPPIHVIVEGEKIVCVAYWSLDDIETD